MRRDIYALIGVAMCITGYIALWAWAGWRVAGAVFMLEWGRNITDSYQRSRGRR